MARSNVEPASGQNPQRPMGQPQEDLGDLTAVLADIMPILDRIQNRSPQAGALGLFGHASVETLAAVSLVSDLGADSLRRLTAYLDAHAQNFSGLETCAPVVAAAARALAARDYAQAFTLLFEVYRTITLLRLEDNKLPAPGSVTQRDARRSGSEKNEGSPPH
jgi:hypothetical protein